MLCPLPVHPRGSLAAGLEVGKLRQGSSSEAGGGSLAQHCPAHTPRGCPSFSQVTEGTATPVTWQLSTRGVPMSASSVSCCGSWVPGGSEEDEQGQGCETEQGQGCGTEQGSLSPPQRGLGDSSWLSPQHSPWTVRMKLFWSWLATFSAMHVYVPELESCRSESCSTREPGRSREQGIRTAGSRTR